RSGGTLSDPKFRISVSGWHRAGSGKLADELSLVGPVHQGSEARPPFMVNEAVFRLVEAVRGFQQRSSSERNPEANRLAWGEIPELATQAGAVLDSFLRDTIVLRPRMLEMGLERVQSGDDVAVRISPTFVGAPDAWLHVFDKSRLSKLYKVVDGSGGYHEVI